MRERIVASRRVQNERGSINRDLAGSVLDELPVEAPVAQILKRAVDTGVITGRGYDRVRRVARTVADLDGSESVRQHHLGEAMSLRGH